MPTPVYGTDWRNQSKPVQVTSAGRVKLPFAVTLLLLLANVQLFVVILVLYLLYGAAR